MSAKLWEVSTINAFNTTLSGGISDTDTTIGLTSVVGLQFPGILCIDRVDENGDATEVLREFVSFTGVAGNTITGCTRGVAGSTAQNHNSSAVVEENFSVSHWGEMIDFLQVSHGSAGNILTSLATILTLRSDIVHVKTHLNASGASVTLNSVDIGTRLNASGASVTGYFPTPLRPFWTVNALASSPSPYASAALVMPEAKSFNWFSVTLDKPASGASYVFDVNKNGTSIFATGTRLTIVGGGTYASTASIATKTFTRGDTFWIDNDIIGFNSTVATIQAEAT